MLRDQLAESEKQREYLARTNENLTNEYLGALGRLPLADREDPGGPEWGKRQYEKSMAFLIARLATSPPQRHGQRNMHVTDGMRNLPLHTGRHDNEAAKALGEVYRHSLGGTEHPSIGVVEVGDAKRALASAYAVRDSLRAELAQVLAERDGAVSTATQLGRERDRLAAEAEHHGAVLEIEVDAHAETSRERDEARKKEGGLRAALAAEEGARCTTETALSAANVREAAVRKALEGVPCDCIRCALPPTRTRPGPCLEWIRTLLSPAGSS